MRAAERVSAWDGQCVVSLVLQERAVAAVVATTSQPTHPRTQHSLPSLTHQNTTKTQAVARQQDFERSAVGKATMKAVKAAKVKEHRPEGPDMAADWRS